MANLSLEAFEKVKHRGRKYTRIKTFKKEKEANQYVEELKKTEMRSKRFPPIVQKVPIGFGLGYRYRVWVLKKM